MAGDWIKLQHVTPDKPEVYEIATRLAVRPEQILGHLARIWIWADQQSRDGHALCVTDVTLDSIARCDGLASAMREVGWLTGYSGNLTFPNFERHNGQSAKKRALAADRQHKSRENLSRSQRDESVTREEKRRVLNKAVSNETEADNPPHESFWTIGTNLLKTSGLKEKDARAVLGRHAKRDKAKLAAVVAQMALQPPVDPVAYLEKSMQPQALVVAL
jgi:hypothetical protein